MNLYSHSLFLTSQYIPHGHCYLWQTPLVGLHVIADALIGLSYYSIPLLLIYFVRQVEDLPFKGIFILFGAFILSCGTTHLGEIWTLWHPNYWIYGVLKAITALISLYTTLSLIPLIPKALHLPSPQQVAALNHQLQEQIVIGEDAKQKLFELNQELEQRVQEKTSALVEANLDLQASTKFREKLTDLTPNILYLYDLNTKSNIYCSSFVSELLGYSSLELQKFKDGLLEELIHPEDLPLVQQHFKNCSLLEDDKYLEIEYRIKNSQGKWHWLQEKNTIFSRNKSRKAEQILGIAQDVTENRKIQLQTEELNQKLEEQVLALARNNQARIKLAEMNEFIQACFNLEEAQAVIGDLLKPLFPDTDGVIYLMSNSKHILNAISCWGNAQLNQHFEPKDCWGIRRGSPHNSQPSMPTLYCAHLDRNTDLDPTLCLPMIAKGETVGMLHLRFKNSDTFNQSIQDLAATVAQNLAISFANLKLQQELRYQSLRDPLTGLYNRRYLDEALGKEIDQANRTQQLISLIMLDIDHFKRFNDLYGHRAGDLVLSQVGKYLESETRKYDLACRFGGEELMIVMTGASIENSLIRAEKIRAGIKQLGLKYEGQQLGSITVSIGVSCFPDDSTTVEGLIQAADKALYQAKEAGRDCVRKC